MQLVKSNNSLALAPANNRTLALMPTETKDVISAALLPGIRSVEPAQAVSDLVTIVGVITTIAGQKIDDNTLEIYVEEFYNQLLKDKRLSALSIEEIRTALRSGIYGSYGKYFGINPLSLYQFCKAYYFSEERTEALAKFEEKRLLLSSSQDLTPQQRAESKQRLTNIQYADFLAGRLIVEMVMPLVFEYLEQTGKISLPRSEKDRIKQIARGIYARQRNSPAKNNPA